MTFFHILIPDITNEEEQLVDEAIIKTYNLYKITHDNDSIYVPGTGKKQLKKMPIIGDLYDVLIENKYTRRVANILSKFVTGSASSFNQQTNVNLNNKFIVFDLQDLTGTMKGVGMFIVMDFLWSKIKENRIERKAVFIDEGWQLIGASSDSRAADFVIAFSKSFAATAALLFSQRRIFPTFLPLKTASTARPSFLTRKSKSFSAWNRRKQNAFKKSFNLLKAAEKHHQF